MALNRSEKINLLQMAMKRVNVVPYGENQIAFGTNNEKLFLGNQQLPSARAISTFRTKSIPVMLAFLFLCPMP